MRYRCENGGSRRQRENVGAIFYGKVGILIVNFCLATVTNNNTTIMIYFTQHHRNTITNEDNLQNKSEGHL